MELTVLIYIQIDRTQKGPKCFSQVYSMSAPTPDAFFLEGAPLRVEITDAGGRTAVFKTKARALTENSFRLSTTGDYEGASLASYQINASTDDLGEAYTSLGKKLSSVIYKLIEKDAQKLMQIEK